MSATSHNTGGLDPDHVIRSTGELAVFLGGSDDSFTGMLLLLIAKSDPGNYDRIRAGFPREVRAWELWFSADPAPTAADLAILLDADAQAGQGVPLPKPHAAVKAAMISQPAAFTKMLRGVKVVVSRYPEGRDADRTDAEALINITEGCLAFTVCTSELGALLGLDTPQIPQAIRDQIRDMGVS